MHRQLAAPFGLAITLISLSVAQADEHAGAGSKEIAAESMFIIGHQSQGDAELTQMSVLGGVTLRYFMRDRVSVGVTVGGFYKSTGPDESDRGGLGRALVSYYVPLASQFYIAPTAGAGLMVGSRQVPIGGDTILSRTLVGGTVSASLPFVLYTGSKFDVRAGPELVVAVGSVAAPSSGGDSESFVNIDGGFSVGASWSF